jgi:hypothetical protein
VDCDVFVSAAFSVRDNSDSADVPSVSAAVVHGTKAGRLHIEDTTITVDADDVNAVRSLAAKDEPFYAPSMVERGETVDPAMLDQRLELGAVTIRGDAAGLGKYGRMAVDIRNRRHESSLSDCVIRQPGPDRDGIRVVAADGVSVTDSVVDVTGVEFDVDETSAETFTQSNIVRYE